MRVLIIEVFVVDKKTSFLVKLDEKQVGIWRNVIPFETELNVWKEEVYFSTPVELKLSRDDLVYKVVPGRVYYWPPGKAMCLFYGLTEAYTPVAPIGQYVGPLTSLRTVESGEKAIVKEHRIYDKYADIIQGLEQRGYLVGTPLSDGTRIIVASKNIGRYRLSFNIYIEDYGYHIESDELLPYLGDYNSIRILRYLKELLKDSRLLRADISEDNSIVITSGINKEDLWNAIEELEQYYPLLIKILWNI